MRNYSCPFRIGLFRKKVVFVKYEDHEASWSNCFFYKTSYRRWNDVVCLLGQSHYYHYYYRYNYNSQKQILRELWVCSKLWFLIFKYWIYCCTHRKHLKDTSFSIFKNSKTTSCFWYLKSIGAGVVPSTKLVDTTVITLKICSNLLKKSFFAHCKKYFFLHIPSSCKLRLDSFRKERSRTEIV